LSEKSKPKTAAKIALGIILILVFTAGYATGVYLT